MYHPVLRGWRAYYHSRWLALVVRNLKDMIPETGAGRILETSCPVPGMYQHLELVFSARLWQS